MRPIYGDDYAIACCVSAMRVGKQMQFFGARCQPGQAACCYAINGGVDEMQRTCRSGPEMPAYQRRVPGLRRGDASACNMYRQWLASLYVNTHEHHPLHARQVLPTRRRQMALHDTEVQPLDGLRHCGPVACVADSLSAIKYAKVRAVRDENGVIVDFEIEGDFPKYGNDDDRVDSIACEQVEQFYRASCKKHPLYRGADPHAVHPDHHLQRGVRQKDRLHAGRPQGTANRWHRAQTRCSGRDVPRRAGFPQLGGKAALRRTASDGISNTFSIIAGCARQDR